MKLTEVIIWLDLLMITVGLELAPKLIKKKVQTTHGQKKQLLNYPAGPVPVYIYEPLHPVLRDGVGSSCCSGPFLMAPAQPNCCQIPSPPACCQSPTPPVANVHMNVGGQPFVVSMNVDTEVDRESHKDKPSKNETILNGTEGIGSPDNGIHGDEGRGNNHTSTTAVILTESGPASPSPEEDSSSKPIIDSANLGSGKPLDITTNKTSLTGSDPTNPSQGSQLTKTSSTNTSSGNPSQGSQFTKTSSTNTSSGNPSQEMQLPKTNKTNLKGSDPKNPSQGIQLPKQMGTTPSPLGGSGSQTIKQIGDTMSIFRRLSKILTGVINKAKKTDRDTKMPNAGHDDNQNQLLPGRQRNGTVGDLPARPKILSTKQGNDNFVFIMLENREMPSTDGPRLTKLPNKINSDSNVENPESNPNNPGLNQHMPDLVENSVGQQLGEHQQNNQQLLRNPHNGLKRAGHPNRSMQQQMQSQQQLPSEQPLKHEQQAVQRHHQYQKQLKQRPLQTLQDFFPHQKKLERQKQALHQQQQHQQQLEVPEVQQIKHQKQLHHRQQQQQQVLLQQQQDKQPIENPSKQMEHQKQLLYQLQQQQVKQQQQQKQPVETSHEQEMENQKQLLYQLQQQLAKQKQQYLRVPQEQQMEHQKQLLHQQQQQQEQTLQQQQSLLQQPVQQQPPQHVGVPKEQQMEHQKQLLYQLQQQLQHRKQQQQRDESRKQKQQQQLQQQQLQGQQHLSQEQQFDTPDDLKDQQQGDIRPVKVTGKILLANKQDSNDDQVLQDNKLVNQALPNNKQDNQALPDSKHNEQAIDHNNMELEGQEPNMENKLNNKLQMQNNQITAHDVVKNANMNNTLGNKLVKQKNQIKAKDVPKNTGNTPTKVEKQHLQEEQRNDNVSPPPPNQNASCTPGTQDCRSKTNNKASQSDKLCPEDMFISCEPEFNPCLKKRSIVSCTQKLHQLTSSCCYGNKNSLTSRKVEVNPRVTMRAQLRKKGSCRHQALLDHNMKRILHHVPPLRLHAALNHAALKYARKLAQIGTVNLQHSPKEERLGQGENLAITCNKPAKPYNCTAITNRWYDERTKYNWDKPGFTKDTGHFTQIIWKNTKFLGIGRAEFLNKEGKTCHVVVARYKPSGNVDGQFQDNVQR